VSLLLGEGLRAQGSGLRIGTGPRYVVVAILVVVAGGCQRDASQSQQRNAVLVERSRVSMGSELHLTAWTADDTTALAANNIRLGIYANTSDTNPSPGALLFDSGSLSAATTGLKSATANLVLVPGNLYWLAFISQNATIIVSGWSSSNAYGILGFNNTDLSTSQLGIGLYIDSVTFGALPNPFGTTGLTIYGPTVGNIPLVTVDFSA